MVSLYLASRNVFRRKRSSLMLAAAVAFGVCIVTTADCIAGGAVNSMTGQFASLFGGHLFVSGTEISADGSKQDIMRNDGLVEEVIQSINVPYTHISKRSSATGSLIFEGKKIMNTVYGCDFSSETFLTSTMTLTQGSWENMKNGSGIILEKSVAADLKANIGETVIFQTQTVNGQAAFNEFTVAAVSEGGGFLGGTAAYADIRDINALIELPENTCTLYTVMLQKGSQQEQAAVLLEQAMGKKAPVTDRLAARKASPANPVGALQKQIKKSAWEGTKYQIFTINDQIPSLAQMNAGVQGGTTGMLFFIFIIIMIGISNTYKMILYERIRETGTMRALGMKRSQTRRVFTLEAVLLTVTGAAAGFILAAVLIAVVTSIPLPSGEMNIFLTNGKLTSVLSPGSLVLKLVLILVLTVLAVRGTAKKAAGLKPADALRTAMIVLMFAFVQPSGNLYAQNVSASQNASAGTAATAAISAADASVQNAPISEEDAERGAAIIEKVYDMNSVSTSDFSCITTLVVQRPGEIDENLQFRLFERSRTHQFTLVQLFPEADKGQGYLVEKNSLFFYDPVSRKFSHRPMEENIGESDVKTDDFNKKYSWRDEYKVTSLVEGKLGSFPVWIISVKAISKKPLYAIDVYYIRKDLPILLKRENYSTAGRLMRTVLMPKYTQVDGKYIAVHTIVRDELNKGEQTQQLLSEISLGAVPDVVFTKAYLESLN